MSRRFAWLAAFIVVLFGGYTAGWFYLAGEIETRARAEIAGFSGEGRSAECVNLDVRGYPFRIGLWCDGVRIVDPGEGLELSANRLRSAAQIYDPFHIVAEVDSPASLSLQGMGSISADWDVLRASVRASFDFPERVSVETRGIEALLANGMGSFSAAEAQAHLRRAEQDLEIAVSFHGATFGDEVLRGGTLPPLDGAFDAIIEGGVRLVRQAGSSLRGVGGTLRTLSLSTGANASVAFSGPFYIASDGLVDAELMLKVRDPEAISDVLENLFPDAREEIRQSLIGLQAFGVEAEVPLLIEGGRVSLGILPLGELPPLR
ncbi:MAG: DUF2125 domain-containing protein [Rhizobiaceae bacterium]